MKTNKLLLLTLLLSGVMMLAACAPEPASETTPEEPQEPPKPEPTEPISEPEPIEPVEEPYPYPEPGAGAQPIDPDAYPAPGEVVSDEPYPGVGNDIIIHQVLTSKEFSELPVDKGLQSGRAYINGTQLIMKESYPIQVELLIIGDLPTPCHQLRVVTSEPNENGHIQIQVYSLSNPETMCTQVLAPFEVVVPLGDFTEGDFTYSINDDEFDGKFQLP